MIPPSDCFLLSCCLLYRFQNVSVSASLSIVEDDRGDEDETEEHDEDEAVDRDEDVSLDLVVRCCRA